MNDAKGNGLDGNRRIANILWLGAEKFGLLLLSGLSFLIFAIYLTPTELGLAAIAIACSELLTRFLCATIETPLVRRKAAYQVELSSAFWWGGIFSVFLTSIIGTMVIVFNPQSSIGPMLIVLTLSVCASILARPFIAKLRHQRKFKDLALRTLLGKVGGSVMAIIVAYNGGGEWSLVIQLIGVNIISLIVLFRGDKSFLFIKPSLRCFFNLCCEGIQFAFRHILEGIFERGVVLLLAMVTTPAFVGYFTFARRLVELPKQALDSAIASYSIPVFSQRVVEKSAIESLFNQISVLTVFLSAPTFIFYGLFGEALIPLIFGDKWLQASPYFLYFAFIATLQMITVYVPSLQVAFATSNIGFRSEIWKTIVTLILAYWLGSQYGIEAVIAVIALDVFLLLLIRLYSIKSFLNISLKALALKSLALIFASIVTAVSGIYAATVLELGEFQFLMIGLAALLGYFVLCKTILGISFMSLYAFIKHSK